MVKIFQEIFRKPEIEYMCIDNNSFEKYRDEKNKEF